MWNQYKNLSRLSSTAADAAKRGYVATKHLAKQSYQKRLFQHPKNSLVPVTLLTEDDIRLFAHHEAAWSPPGGRSKSRKDYCIAD
jgi:hypothetical protein